MKNTHEQITKKAKELFGNISIKNMSHGRCDMCQKIFENSLFSFTFKTFDTWGYLRNLCSDCSAIYAFWFEKSVKNEFLVEPAFVAYELESQGYYSEENDCEICKKNRSCIYVEKMSSGFINTYVCSEECLNFFMVKHV